MWVVRVKGAERDFARVLGSGRKLAESYCRVHEFWLLDIACAGPELASVTKSGLKDAMGQKGGLQVFVRSRFEGATWEMRGLGFSQGFSSYLRKWGLPGF